MQGKAAAARMTSPVEWCTCGATHHPGANYYASVEESPGGQVILADGPYSTHAIALGAVERVRRFVLARYDGHGRAHWYGYGTLAMAHGFTEPGKLTAELEAAE